MAIFANSNKTTRKVTIIERINAVKSELSDGCKLIIVSKNRPLAQIQEAYNSGHRIFAENRVQNLLERKDALPEDVQWHLIGHLQTNKVKYIAPFVAMVHSLDSIKLAAEINKQAKNNNRVIKCLLQLHVAQEASKFGILPAQIDDFMRQFFAQQFEHIQLCGVMGMASFVTDEKQILHEFQQIKSVFNTLKVAYFKDIEYFKEVSMGMSGDYLLAQQQGSTMVRIGSLLFE